MSCAKSLCKLMLLNAILSNTKVFLIKSESISWTLFLKVTTSVSVCQVLKEKIHVQETSVKKMFDANNRNAGALCIQYNLQVLYNWFTVIWNTTWIVLIHFPSGFNLRITCWIYLPYFHQCFDIQFSKRVSYFFSNFSPLKHE